MNVSSKKYITDLHRPINYEHIAIGIGVVAVVVICIVAVVHFVLSK